MLFLENLVFGYPSRKWKFEGRAELSAGQLLPLLGKNGAGKSTFLRTLGRLLPPVSGTITIDNQDINKYTMPDYARLVSVVRTEKVDIPYCSVRELLAFGRLPHTDFWGTMRKEDWQKVEQVLEELQLEPLANRQISTLSDGEMQLAMLGRALVQDTPVVLLDEISAHLDFINRRRVFAWLEAIANRQNKLLLMATHELELALAHSKQFIIFADNTAQIIENQNFVVDDVLAFWGN